jgi:hypothetical protein
MARFLVNLLAFAICLTIAVLATFYLSCWTGIIALILSLFLAERAGMLK